MSTDSKLATTITPTGQTNNYVSKINNYCKYKSILVFLIKKMKRVYSKIVIEFYSKPIVESIFKIDSSHLTNLFTEV